MKKLLSYIMILSLAGVVILASCRKPEMRLNNVPATVAVPPGACDNTNRPKVNAQLIPVGTLSQARSQMSVASTANKIVFAGGVDASQVSSRVDIYDITSNTWSTHEL